jgi:dTDP-4-amino-4,6-dideoxygalactose transaminase
MKVPFLDLKAQYESIKDEINEAIQKVLDSCAFAGGPFVEEFEKNFAKFCEVKHCVGVGSGTEALWMALLALGVGPGDEVITVPNTFIATAEAISFCGATPVFIDIDKKTYTMDPEKLKEFIEQKCDFNQSTNQLINQSTKRPLRAIIPVHLFGQMADMDPIMEIAKANNLFVVEDACQAHGAEYNGKRAGSIGDAGCFSFYPGKNLGAYGEAGAITANNSELVKKMAMFRDHGQSKKYYHDMIGWNARMDGIQGAVLNVKLKHLPVWNEARRENARLYNELFATVDNIIEPIEAKYARHVYHVYAVRVKNRASLIAAMADKEIYCGIHYPVPVHLQQAYESSGIKNGSCPVAEKCAEEYVSLPMFPELKSLQVEHVVEEIKNILYLFD